MSKVHFDPDDPSYVKPKGYITKFYAACGEVVTYITPKRGTIDKLEVTYDPTEVTCKNCKRTTVWKEEKQSQ